MSAPLDAVITEADRAILSQTQSAQPRYKFDPERASLGRIRREAPKEMPWVIYNLFPVDVGLLIATGGKGKSSALLWMVIRYAIGLDVLGVEVPVPGRVLILSGEDDEGRIGYRVNQIAESMGLTPEQLATLDANVKVEDMSDFHAPFVATEQGNLVITSVADDLIERYQEFKPSWVILDPLAAHGANESTVNDGATLMIKACRKISKAFHCFTQIVHHQSKEAVRADQVGQHAGRGGTALGDGARLEMQVTTHYARSTNMPSTLTNDWFAQGGSVMLFHITKLTDAAIPLAPYCVGRMGWRFDNFAQTAIPGTTQVDRAKSALMGFYDQVYAYVRDHPDVILTKNKLSERNTEIAAHAQKIGMYVDVPASQKKVEAVVSALLDEGRLREEPLPPGVGKGRQQARIVAVEPVASKF